MRPPAPGEAPRRRLLLAFLVGAASVFAAALAFVESGIYDVAASRPHGPLAYWVIRTTMERSVVRRAARTSAPPRFTAQQAQAGFRLYETHCVICHGGPGVGPGPMVGPMTPPPPPLIDAARHWSPSELYWLVRNGVKMTAMPAWADRLDARQTWEVVAFLQRLPSLDYPTYARMRAELAGATPPGAGGGPAAPAN